DLTGAGDHGLVAGDRQAAFVEGDVGGGGALVVGVEHDAPGHWFALTHRGDLRISGAGVLGDEHRQSDAQLGCGQSDPGSGEHGRAHHLCQPHELRVVDLTVEGTGLCPQDRVTGFDDV